MGLTITSDVVACNKFLATEKIKSLINFWLGYKIINLLDI